MLSVEEYLNLTDWKFQFQVTAGAHGDYFWIRSQQLLGIDYANAMKAPSSSFRILVIDCYPQSRDTYLSKGWQALGDFILSPPIADFADLDLSEYCTQMVLDAEMSSIQILEAAINFEESMFPEAVEMESVQNFWRVIEELKPAYFLSHGAGVVFAARGEERFNAFMSSEPVRAVEANYRRQEYNHRSKLWKTMGPELGPETCNEEECDRLRIQQSMKCFIHQLQSV